MRRYSVVRTYDGHYSTDRYSLGGIFRHYNQAIKERDRRNQRDRLVLHAPEDILRRYRPSWKKNEPHEHKPYRWRVLDLGSRTFAD
jgi:hypothetical protein